MKKPNLKKEKILVILSMLIFFSLVIIPFTDSVGCCLNPAADINKVCQGDVDEAECCASSYYIDDYSNYLYGYAPLDENECKTTGNVFSGYDGSTNKPFFEEGIDCASTASDICRVVVCCCDHTDPTQKYLEPICRNLGYTNIVSYNDGDGDDVGSPCLTECGITNNPPTATIDSPITDVTITVGDSVNFEGTASDTDGTIVSYLWDFNGGATNMNVEDPGNIQFDTAGIYTVTFTVTDDGGAIALDSVVVTVNPAGNNAPVLNTIGDRTIGEGSLLTFTISATDPDGDTLTYSTTALPTGATFDPTTMIFSWTPSYGQATSYTVTFTVTDGFLIDDETITITVTSVAPPPVSACTDFTSKNPTIDRVNIRQGSSGLQLIWRKPTLGAGDPDPDSYLIYRSCTSCGNTDWFFLAEVTCGNTVCNRIDLTAEWGKTYSYVVSANYYGIESAFSSASSSISTGEKDCQGRTAYNDFCLNNIAYMGCNNNIKQIGNNCEAQNKICIMDGPDALCRNDGLCDGSGEPFDLYYTGSTSLYTLYDFSKTTIDRCYSCSDVKDCYNYKSEDACNDDDCGVGNGNCEWNSYNYDLSKGVCVDTEKDNCMFCSEENTDALNYEAYNSIFDLCTLEKASLLSTTNYPCYYFSSTQTAKSCEQATCYDFDTSAMCGSSRDDICGFGVCYWNGFCMKDADNDQSTDCGGSEDCRKDMNPPLTNIFIPKPVLNGIGDLYVEASDAETTVRETYFCLDQTNECDPRPSVQGCAVISTITLAGVDSEVIGQTSCSGNILQEGTNYITFYSIDEYSNVEATKSVQFDIDTTPPTIAEDSDSDCDDVCFIAAQTPGTTSGTKLTVTMQFDEQVRCGFVGSNGLNINEPIESATCYSNSYEKVFDNLADRNDYTLIVTCEDVIGNRDSEIYVFNIDNDPSITLVAPQNILYDSEPDIIVRTPGDVDCRYSQNPSIVEHASMGSGLTSAADGNTFLHTLSTSYIATDGSNIFNIACYSSYTAVESRQTVSFVYDILLPAISALDSDGDQFNFGSGSPHTAGTILTLRCRDYPRYSGNSIGFGCKPYYCLVALGPDCTPQDPGSLPLIEGKDSKVDISLAESKKICYQAVEEITDKKLGANCNDVYIDSVAPSFIFGWNESNSGPIDTEIVNDWPTTTITTGTYEFSINGTTDFNPHATIYITANDGNDYDYEFTVDDYDDANKKYVVSLTIDKVSTTQTKATLKTNGIDRLVNIYLPSNKLKLKIKGYDIAGNLGTQFNYMAKPFSILEFSVDITPPLAPTITEISSGTKIDIAFGDTNYLNIKSGEDVTVKGTVADTDTKYIKIYVNTDNTLNGATLVTPIITSAGQGAQFTHNIVASTFASDGTYYILVTAEDGLGNSVTTTQIPVVVMDNTQPTITFNFPDPANTPIRRAYTELGSLDVDLNDDLSGINSNSICVKVYSGATYYGTRDATTNCLTNVRYTVSNGKLTYTLSSITTLTPATYTISVYVSDRSGNSYTNTSQFGINEMVPTDPAISFMQGTTSKTADKSETISSAYTNYYYFKTDIDKITFTFTDQENVKITTATLKIGAGTANNILASDLDAQDHVYSYSYTFTEGKYEFKIKAKRELDTGVYGAEGTWTYYLIIDKTMPVISNIKVYRLVDDKGTTATSDDVYVVANKGVDDDNKWLTNTENIRITGDYVDANIKEIKFTNDLVNAITATLRTGTFTADFTADMTLIACTGDSACTKTVNLDAGDKAFNDITPIPIEIKLDTTGLGLEITNIDLDGAGASKVWETFDTDTTYYTKYLSISIKGRAKVGSEIKVVKNEVIYQSIITWTGAPDTNGIDEFVLNISLSTAGDYEFIIRATGLEGARASIGPVKVTKDTAAPTITLTETNNDIRILANNKGATQITNPTLEITTSEPTICKAQFLRSPRDNIYIQIVFTGYQTKNYQLMHLQDLANKNLINNWNNDIIFECEDEAGNILANHIITIKTDNVKPLINNVIVEGGEETETINANEKNYVVYWEPPFIQLKVEANEKVRCRYEKSDVAYNSMQYEFTNFATFISNPISGEINDLVGVSSGVTTDYYIACEDEAGNIVQTNFIAHVEYNPSAQIPLRILEPRDYTRNQRPLIKVETDRQANCFITISGIETTMGRNGNYHSYSAWASDLSEETHNFDVRCEDDSWSGLEPRTITLSFTVDTTPPNTPVITSPATGSAFASATITVSGTIDIGNEGELVIFIDGDTSKSTTVTDTGTQSFSIANVRLVAGANTIKVKAKDRAGNIGAASDPITVNYITTSPGFSYMNPSHGTTVHSAEEIKVGFTLVGVPIDFENTIIDVLKDTTTFTGTTSQVSVTEISFTPDAEFTNGDYNVGITVCDVLENCDFYEKSFTVDDTTPTTVITGYPGGSTTSTNIKQIDITGTVTDAEHDITKITIKVYDSDDNVFRSVSVSIGTYKHSVSIAKQITLTQDDTYRFEIIAENALATSTYTFYITFDTEAPGADIDIR